MFKFIFDLLTEPLGLPIKWYEEWIVLCIIEGVAIHIAREKVGRLYHLNMISGQMSGSFVHWIIRSFCFIGIWAITYGAIWFGKFAMENKVLVGTIVGTVLLIVIVVRVLLWNCRGKGKSPE